MTRVYICQEWNEREVRYVVMFCTDSAKAADRWRRDAPGRIFVDYVVFTKDEMEARWKESP